MPCQRYLGLGLPGEPAKRTIYLPRRVLGKRLDTQRKVTAATRQTMMIGTTMASLVFGLYCRKGLANPGSMYLYENAPIKLIGRADPLLRVFLSGYPREEFFQLHGWPLFQSRFTRHSPEKTPDYDALSSRLP